MYTQCFIIILEAGELLLAFGTVFKIREMISIFMLRMDEKVGTSR